MIITSVAWFFGGFAMIATGMGGPQVVLPMLVPFVDMRIIIMVSCCLCLPSDSLIILRFREAMNWRKGLLLAIGSIPGAWFGVFMLKYLPLFWLELGLGVLLLLYLAWQLLSRKAAERTYTETNTGLALFGGACGFFNGCVGIGGPPMSICSRSYNWDKDLARGLFGLVFVVSDIMAVSLYIYHDLLTMDVLKHLALALPTMLLGMAAGLPAARKLKQKQFSGILLLFVFAASLTLLWKAFFMEHPM